jgi:hypothetical protein
MTNECVGGNTGKTACMQDCAGVWDGTSNNDDCGICRGPGPTPGCGCDDIPDGFCDCNGNTLDQCGVCGGNNTTCTDCHGVVNGTSFRDPHYGEDSCTTNECVGGNTGKTACIKDCIGIWGGTAEDDNCGVCDGNNTTCTDCHGVVNGTSFRDPHYGEDSCTTNECVGGNTGKTACIKDCVGIWGGTAEDDNCGVCGGNNTTCIDCNDDINGTAYIDPNCGNGMSCVGGDTGLTACIKDCRGVWGGLKVDDECGICDGNGPEQHYDCDGNCISELDCEGSCGGSDTPEVECHDGDVVCNPAECGSLAIMTHLLPNKFGINNIFPNPFNPVT